jgi:RNA polymerase sigma-70 factor (ECF subfamily)
MTPPCGHLLHGPRVLSQFQHLRVGRCHHWQMHDADSRPNLVAPQLDAADLQLVLTRASAGDAAAFAVIYQNHCALVYGVCVRFTGGDAAWAGELTQDVFVHMWEKLDQFKGDGPFAAWVRRLATNQAINALRAQRRRSEHETVYADLPDPVVATIPFTVDDKMDIESAVSALPQGARTVFLLHDAYGYTDGEIATMTDTARSTVRSQLHRARKLLREALTP